MFGVLFVVVLLASSAEIIFYVIAIVDQVDWLAGVWLAVFFTVGGVVLRQVFVEYIGLTTLKRQGDMRTQSEQMADNSVIDLAEQHCLKIAKAFQRIIRFSSKLVW